MLEHTSMYLPLLDDEPAYPDFYSRVSQCELPDPVWTKMSALTASVNKKRKKSDTKPQAQINKCNNEKRRREQENIYIEELAELISANFADMSSLSVKPDKCAILQETVNQIRSIKQRESGVLATDPVQQGEVSSSRPTILSNEVYGPLLLEALEGFLFVVNSEGRVEHVTENVSVYIRYNQEEILGNSIYNFIHHGDHTRFSSGLLPMTIGWNNENNSRSRSFSCRFLVKPQDDIDDSIEDKTQRPSHYELMHISSTQLRDHVSNEEDSSDGGPCLLCVASRLTHRDKVAGSSSIEQFTTKLDPCGKIIAVDTFGVSSNYAKFLSKDLVGRTLTEVCAPLDANKVSSHLREAISNGQANSGVYRIRLEGNKSVAVQTKSKLFKAQPNVLQEDFIMATHSIIGDDSSGPSDPGGGSSSSVGGPLMTSVVNGGTPSRNGSEGAPPNSLIGTPSNNYFYGLDNEFGLDLLPTSTWGELDTTNWVSEVRPDSRQSTTPVNTPASTPTPRPPSQPVYSPATTLANSPLQHFVAQPSPSMPTTPVSTYNNSFGFSPIGETPGFGLDEQKDQKPIEEASSMMESNKLRILLTKPNQSVVESAANSSTTSSSSSSAVSENKNNANDHKILKGLLKQHDDEDGGDRNRRNSMAGTSQMADNKAGPCGANKLLEKLLNEKPASADEGQQKKMHNEFIKQILNDEDIKQESSGSSDPQSIFSRIPSPNPRKRPNDSSDESSAKRSSDGVSSSGPSKLCEKNKMLAMLLAKEPSNIQNIPPIPPSELTATPQERLPRIAPDPNLMKTASAAAAAANRHMGMNQSAMGNNRGASGVPTQRRTTSSNYLNQLPMDQQQQQQQQQQQRANQRAAFNVDSTYSAPATSSTDWNANSSKADGDGADPYLSYLLEEMIDIGIGNTENDLGLSQANNPPLNEKLAITLIEHSLMQCDQIQPKGTASPNLGLPVSSATPPAYPTVGLTDSQGFGPPPNYPRGNMNMPRPAQALRTNAPQYPGGGNPQLAQLQQQQILQQNRKLIMQQEQHKRRLLLQQQQQQIIVPAPGSSNSITPGDMNSSLQTIDLLNNTVAPNVSLQRSSSVPEQQVSGNLINQFGQANNQRLTSQQSYPGSMNQQTYPNTSIGNFQQGNARLSPNPPFVQQLSPRQGYPQVTTQNSQQNWSQQQARISVQQQQNPMLNAQLTNTYGAPNRQNFSVQRTQQQQQRGIGSPGTATTRNSPFPDNAFAPPASPNSSYNQSQYLRLQRANSNSAASNSMPGSLASPRPFGRDHPPQYPPNNPMPHSNTAPHPMMYSQQDSSYLYDQSMHMSGYGPDRGRSMLPTHLQGGVSGTGTTSEYVRQELRAVVGARTGQNQQPGTVRNQQSQLMNQNVTVPADLEALGFELPLTGASESPKLWGAMAPDIGALSPQAASSRTTTEGGDGGKSSSSLLQKLLSE